MESRKKKESFGEPQERKQILETTTNCQVRGRISTRMAYSIWIVHLFCLISSIQCLDISNCVGSLGMENGDIPDGDLSASSSFDIGTVGPASGRVRQELNGGAWCPRNTISSDAEEFLEIDLHTVHVITATETQGRFGNGVGQEYAEAYVLSYWRPELNKWVRYRDHSGNEIIKGNINTYLAHKSELHPPIIASKLRVLPYSYHRRTVCMRVEIYGCQLKGGLLSYEMPQGSKRGENWNFFDNLYDGFWDGNYLRNGLGILVDGRGGPHNFKDDFYGNERGRGWVGWKNDTSKNSTSPVEIIFKFDSPQEFNMVHIQSSNQFTKDIQVFSEARIYFGMHGKSYSGDPIVYHPKEDCIFEEPKNITINLHHRIAQFVKIELFWATRWILISEITLDSQQALSTNPQEKPQIISEDKSAVTIRSRSGEGSSSGEEVSFAQSDASENLPGNRLLDDIPNIVGHATTLSNKWNTTTIVVTAVISSFIAIVMVLLLIFIAMVARHKLLVGGGRRKSPTESQEGTLPYDNQTDYGYASPEEIRKCKIPISGEYTEPFTNCPPPIGSVPPLITFPSSNFHSNNHGSGGQHAGDSGHPSRMAEYYSCTLISNPITPNNQDSCNEYEYAEYAVPELGKLLQSPLKSIPNSPAAVNRLKLLQVKFREIGVPEISRHHLRMLRKLGDGAFGTVFVGELDVNGQGDNKSLVAVKHLLRNASEKDKSDFLQEVQLLSSLDDENLAQVLGICIDDEPFSVVLEFLEFGDLCQFLRQNDTLLPNSTKKIGFSNLLYIAGQIAQGMKFLEQRNIVHRDLATRNCVIGRGFLVKISHFATDTDLYASDYYRLDGKMPLPIRWMSWESIFLGKYSTKSDVWSYGVLLWEVLSYCRHSPYPTMSNEEVLHNLQRLSVLDTTDPFEHLSKPQGVSRDIYQLMKDTWNRNDESRPNFWEIHSFISRKNLNFIPQSATNSSSGSTSMTDQYMV